MIGSRDSFMSLLRRFAATDASDATAIAPSSEKEEANDGHVRRADRAQGSERDEPINDLHHLCSRGHRVRGAVPARSVFAGPPPGFGVTGDGVVAFYQGHGGAQAWANFLKALGWSR